MIVMYKDPKGETVFSRPGNSTAITESKIGTQNENTTSKEVDVLQHRIQELKELLSVNVNTFVCVIDRCQFAWP